MLITATYYASDLIFALQVLSCLLACAAFKTRIETCASSQIPHTYQNIIIIELEEEASSCTKKWSFGNLSWEKQYYSLFYSPTNFRPLAASLSLHLAMCIPARTTWLPFRLMPLFTPRLHQDKQRMLPPWKERGEGEKKNRVQAGWQTTIFVVACSRDQGEGRR